MEKKSYFHDKRKQNYEPIYEKTNSSVAGLASMLL